MRRSKVCVPTQVTSRVQIAICNYTDIQGNCPPVSLHKENIDLKWPYCATPAERMGMAISFPWRTLLVNCLALCMSVVTDKQEKWSREAHKPGLRVSFRFLTKHWKMWRKKMGVGTRGYYKCMGKSNRWISPLWISLVFPQQFFFSLYHVRWTNCTFTHEVTSDQYVCALDILLYDLNKNKELHTAPIMDHLMNLFFSFISGM